MNTKDTIKAAHLMLEWAQAMEAGKPFELEVGKNNTGQWYKISIEPVWNWETCLYRRKPKPKLVPLGPEDVPPGSVVRCPILAKETWLMVLSVDPRFIGFQEGQEGLTETWETLMEDKWTINRNDGKGWLPCQKEIA